MGHFVGEKGAYFVLVISIALLMGSTMTTSRTYVSSDAPKSCKEERRGEQG